MVDAGVVSLAGAVCDNELEELVAIELATLGPVGLLHDVLDLQHGLTLLVDGGQALLDLFAGEKAVLALVKLFEELV